MNCANGHQNPLGSRFCSQCGVDLLKVKKQQAVRAPAMRRLKLPSSDVSRMLWWGVALTLAVAVIAVVIALGPFLFAALFIGGIPTVILWVVVRAVRGAARLFENERTRDER